MLNMETWNLKWKNEQEKLENRGMFQHRLTETGSPQWPKGQCQVTVLPKWEKQEYIYRLGKKTKFFPIKGEANAAASSSQLHNISNI